MICSVLCMSERYDADDDCVLLVVIVGVFGIVKVMGLWMQDLGEEGGSY